MTRRRVRVDAHFLAELDSQLREDRGPNGEPSATDFLVIDLPTIVEAFAEDFDRLPALYAVRHDYRVLVAKGRLVAAVAVVGQLVDENTVVLFGIDIDL